MLHVIARFPRQQCRRRGQKKTPNVDKSTWKYMYSDSISVHNFHNNGCSQQAKRMIHIFLLPNLSFLPVKNVDTHTLGYGCLHSIDHLLLNPTPNPFDGWVSISTRRPIYTRESRITYKHCLISSHSLPSLVAAIKGSPPLYLILSINSECSQIAAHHRVLFAFFSSYLHVKRYKYPQLRPPPWSSM